MIDFNFKSRLWDNPFARGSDSYDEPFSDIMHQADILLLNPKMVPVIKMTNPSEDAKLPTEELLICSNIAFSGKPLNKLKLAEVVQFAPYLMRILIAGEGFFIGKGFIAKSGEGQRDMIPMMVAVVTDVKTTDIGEMTLLVNPAYKDQPVIVRGVIQDNINNFTGDVIYSAQIDKHLSGKIKLPVFTSIREKREFTEKFIAQCLESL